MSFKEFQESLSQSHAPAGLSPALTGLWHDRRGDWDEAHKSVQDDSSAEAAWVHAYLHRKEGDPGNAAYWYSRAGRPISAATLTEEWAGIARALLGD